MTDYKDKIVATFSKHIGRTITYTPHKDLPEKQRLYSKFVIKEDMLNMIQYYDLDVFNRELHATDDVWAPIGDIAWGQGYHSVLYGNSDGVMFVQNGEREYVTFDN